MIDLSHVAAFVFDLDDTLYPESQFVLSGFRAVAAAFSARLGTPDAAFARMVELSQSDARGRVFDALLMERTGEADPREAAAMVAAYRRHMPVLGLHPDAARLLDRLCGRRRLGLISDGPAETQRNKVRALNLANRFDAIVFTDEMGREFWKPHPRGFQQAGLALCAAGAQLAYIADNPSKDFVAPRALGWHTVMVRRSDGVYRDAVAPAGGAAEACVESLDEVAIGS